ncbi:MAG: hypothetical protein H7334_02525 [Ferruginibacter sp.]|nr:hypothetical protein [Ferruginibacter sp.]
MMKSEWYTNRTWNGEIDTKFEKYLKHTRDPANKASFMQLQGGLLLDNNQQNVQDVGVSLLSRVIEDYPLEHTSVILAQEKLGDYYLRQHYFERAAHFFKVVVKYCKAQNSRSGTSTIADLKLAEALVRNGKDDQLEAAYKLIKDYPVELLKLMDNKFYYTQLAAQVCDVLHKDVEAKEFAVAALALPQIIKPVIKGNKLAVATKLAGRQLKAIQEIAAP